VRSEAMVPGVARTKIFLASVFAASLMAGSVPMNFNSGYFWRRKLIQRVVAVLQAMTIILAPHFLSLLTFFMTMIFSSSSDFSPYGQFLESAM